MVLGVRAFGGDKPASVKADKKLQDASNRQAIGPQTCAPQLNAERVPAGDVGSSPDLVEIFFGLKGLPCKNNPSFLQPLPLLALNVHKRQQRRSWWAFTLNVTYSSPPKCDPGPEVMLRPNVQLALEV
eukprot:2448897-Amphidinium_carterae.1